MTDFGDAVASADKRTQYEAIRNRITEELEPGFDCCNCGKPRRSAGSETAALMLRLVKVLESLESIPDSSTVSRVDELMARRTGGAPNAARRQSGRRRGTGA